MSGKRPAVALYCATFLKPEMLHIHRHVSALRDFRPVVVAQKQEGDWPVERLEIISRSPWRFLARAIEQRSGQPWQISSGETKRILSLLHGEPCALLHIFFGNVAIHLLPLLRRAPGPVVVSFHGSDVAGSMASPGYRPALKELFDRATLVPCRSEQLAQKVAELGCPPAKLRVMRTILPEIPFTTRTAPADQAWKLVQASRLVPKKGVATALRAFADFAGAYPRATFTVAGSGPLEKELRHLAAELGVGDKVEFAGFLDQAGLQRLFRSSHIYLQPSETIAGDTEGVPNALLEAMASGLPAIATQHGGIPEVITDGFGGFLCNEADPVALAAALRQLTGDPSLYAAFSENAARAVRERFSAEKQTAAVEDLYREAILAHSAPAMV